MRAFLINPWAWASKSRCRFYVFNTFLAGGISFILIFYVFFYKLNEHKIWFYLIMAVLTFGGFLIWSMFLRWVLATLGYLK